MHQHEELRAFRAKILHRQLVRALASLKEAEEPSKTIYAFCDVRQSV
jgi:hypothetical protein